MHKIFYIHKIVLLIVYVYFKNIILHRDNVLWNWAPKTCIILLTKINSIKWKTYSSVYFQISLNIFTKYFQIV